MLLIEIEEGLLEVFDVLREHLIVRVEVVDQVLHEQDVVGLEGGQRPLPLGLGPPVLFFARRYIGGVASHSCLRGLSPCLLVVDDATLSHLGLLPGRVSQLGRMLKVEIGLPDVNCCYY